MRLGDLLKRAQEELRHLPDFALDAALICMHVLDLTRVQLVTKSDLWVSKDEETKILDLVKRRAAFEPVAYLLNKKDFMGLTFYVNSDVLIPRGDTEILCEQALILLEEYKMRTPIKESADGLSIRGLEIGVGSGAIGISLLHRMPFLQMKGVDLSPKAIAVCAKNALKHGVSDRFELICADALDPAFYEEQARELRKKASSNKYEIGADEENVLSGYDFILSNPPYISPNQKETLMKDVRDYEPHMALFAEEDGLVFYRTILQNAKKILKKNGFVLFEIGYDQGVRVSEHLEDCGFTQVEIFKDYEGHDRVVSGFCQSV